MVNVPAVASKARRVVDCVIRQSIRLNHSKKEAVYTFLSSAIEEFESDFKIQHATPIVDPAAEMKRSAEISAIDAANTVANNTANKPANTVATPAAAPDAPPAETPAASQSVDRKAAVVSSSQILEPKVPNSKNPEPESPSLKVTAATVSAPAADIAATPGGNTAVTQSVDGNVAVGSADITSVRHMPKPVARRERKKLEKQQKLEQLQRLKNLREKIAEITGSETVPKDVVDLEGEFEPTQVPEPRVHDSKSSEPESSEPKITPTTVVTPTADTAATESIDQNAVGSSKKPASKIADPAPPKTFKTSTSGQTDLVYDNMRGTTPYTRALEKLRTGKPRPTTHPTDRSLLPPRRMEDSYHELYLPFAEDDALLDQYVNAYGLLRMGQLLEDLDSLAGVIAYKHVTPPASQRQADYVPPAIVTASVDRISIVEPMQRVEDVRLSGMVTWVGNSSMEIKLQMETVAKTGEVRHILEAGFSMVCRDPIMMTALPVNPLILDTPVKQEIYAQSEEYNAKKKLASKSSLNFRAPTAAESEEVHKTWLALGSESMKPQDAEWMENTKQYGTQLMTPAARNIHTTMIFGGYLLRLTFELGHCCAAAWGKSRPVFVSLDSTSFKSPVPVGSILDLEAMVVHTSPCTSPQVPEGSGLVQVRVQAMVRDIETGERRVAGEFAYTYRVKEHKKVVPKTYGEFVEWIAGKRRMEQSKLWGAGSEVGME
ncbi:hypothetical protein YB2330_002898 [Saitoella coloradoensis]